MDELELVLSKLDAMIDKYDKDILLELTKPACSMEQLKYLSGRSTGVKLAYNAVHAIKEKLLDA